MDQTPVVPGTSDGVLGYLGIFIGCAGSIRKMPDILQEDHYLLLNAWKIVTDRWAESCTPENGFQKSGLKSITNREG